MYLASISLGQKSCFGQVQKNIILGAMGIKQMCGCGNG